MKMKENKCSVSIHSYVLNIKKDVAFTVLLLDHSSQSFSSVSQLVQHYHDKQRQDRTSRMKTSSKTPLNSCKAKPDKEISPKMFSV